jgi:hypothetical protein
MAEFNPDGSLKLPESVLRQKEANRQRMASQRCMRVKREIISHSAPKKCVLSITLSDAIRDSRFIQTILGQCNFKTPMKARPSDGNGFEIEIGTDFFRCSECSSLIGQYKEFLDGNLIDEKGSCTFEGRRQNFCDEDYFD